MSDGFLPGVILGAVCAWGYYAWDKTPQAIINVQEQLDSAEVLIKVGSGQVAIVHGFVDDYGVCRMMADCLERDGGKYGCLPAAQSPKPPKY